MRILETDNWSLLLPPEWRAEQDDEGVLISDRDGVGCLEITALVAASGAVAAADVHAMAGDSPPLQQLTLAGHRAWYREVDEHGRCRRRRDSRHAARVRRQLTLPVTRTRLLPATTGSARARRRFSSCPSMRFFRAMSRPVKMNAPGGRIASRNGW